MSREVCPICQGADLQLREKETELWSIPSPGQIAVCSSCGFRFVVNPATEFVNLKHYEGEEYHKHHGDKRLFFRQRLEELLRLAPGRKILDIGCATGQFLEVASEVGFDAFGVEPTEYAAGVARSRGLNVHHGFVSDLPDGEYDVVHSNHVLEHIPEPVVFMKDVARVLKPNGIACIEVPNEFDNLPYILNRIMGTRKPRAVPSPHVSFFDIRSLKQIFARANLRLLQWETHTELAPRGLINSIRFFPNNAVRRLGDLLKKGRNTVCLAKKE
ncbi:MAG TPA: methyltransferase domain-containing protein [bacterium]|nr:methyltransferase domain-containing protein [bacterium]